MNKQELSWYEFFAGGGMARLGLSEEWRCSFANEWCEKKAAAYKAHFGKCDELRIDDIANVVTADIPGRADLAWASFPCQDLSLAGSGAGLEGKRSGTFIPFWRLIKGLAKERRAPRIIVLENVVGTLTSHRGNDFAAIIRAFSDIGYRAGCVVIDAARFVPQSRPRLFVIGVSATAALPRALISVAPSEPWHPKPLRVAVERLPRELDTAWTWWRLPIPNDRVKTLNSVIEEDPTGVNWHTPAETKYLLSLMSTLHQSKVEAAKKSGSKIIGTVYRRTRPARNGPPKQRAEVRFDNIAGCLRTPVGGSSRQTVIIVERNRIRSRLLSPREAANLMGLPDTYVLPGNYNEAYHLVGDGVVVPVVAWLEKHLLRPLALANRADLVHKQIA